MPYQYIFKKEKSEIVKICWHLIHKLTSNTQTAKSPAHPGQGGGFVLFHLFVVRQAEYIYCPSKILRDSGIVVAVAGTNTLSKGSVIFNTFPQTGTLFIYSEFLCKVETFGHSKQETFLFYLIYFILFFDHFFSFQHLAQYTMIMTLSYKTPLVRVAYNFLTSALLSFLNILILSPK